jgi:hypothetical protein
MGKSGYLPVSDHSAQLLLGILLTILFTNRAWSQRNAAQETPGSWNISGKFSCWKNHVYVPMYMSQKSIGRNGRM